MRGYENQVRSAVEQGQVVRYSATPIYNGSELAPRGIKINGSGSQGFTLDVTILNPLLNSSILIDMSIEQLEKILEPPIDPVDRPVANGWSAVEKKLGKLPDDYKRFIEMYGTGSIDGFVWIFNPFAANKNLNLLDQVLIKISALSDLGDTFGEAIPFPLFPKPNGLLPFGVTDNGDVLFWQAASNPAGWKVIINAAREPKWKQYDVGITDLLTGLLSRQMICEVFPGDFPSDRPVFYPSVL